MHFPQVFYYRTSQNSKKTSHYFLSIFIMQNHHTNITQLTRNIHEFFLGFLKDFLDSKIYKNSQILTKNSKQNNKKYYIYFPQVLTHKNITKRSRKISQTYGKFYGIFIRIFEWIGVQEATQQVYIAKKPKQTKKPSPNPNLHGSWITRETRECWIDPNGSNPKSCGHERKPSEPRMNRTGSGVYISP